MSSETASYEAQAWIKDLFEDEEIDMPDFRNNEEAQKLMSKIILLNKEREKDVKEIIKIESYLTDYYTEKGEEISSKFSSFSKTDLQPDVVENVNKIASVATLMKLKEPTATNFLQGSSYLIRRRDEQNEQELMDGYRLSKISKKITDMIHKNIILERNIDSLHKKVFKQLKTKPVILEQCRFFKTKSEEYMKRIHKAERQLQVLGFNPSVSHSELVKRSDLLQILEADVNELSDRLESYQNLPPNETLTRFKIEEAQGDLLRLQTEFDNLLKMI